ncbi:MAG: D-cysteine desulfhydrase family protein [Desulfobacula sp.]|uniref:D-cysteine desulfhydrase family protein n=1 Tax=Desulfobacula sp. TaxID=2593537 RepID=UPI0025BB4F6E|nr:D-cysteine desulfhydrase family protein [Desulfobacula sp.]MCD4720718.1 D-cysteine desulfhydrase family protein [Desulfobacula sp.]
MKLDNLPRFHLAEFPTPIQYLAALTKAYNGPGIYMKRDDLTSLGMGGNKTRKLEFLIGEALEQNKDTLVTAGGIQSNHCRLTAAAARKAGLDCHLVLNGTEPKIPNGNLLLDIIFGATIHYCERKDRDERLLQVADKLAEVEKKPYLIPVGGSNSIGAVGYVTAMLELASQIKDMDISPDAIVFATSSGGTQAGLTLGAKITGFKGDVLGISIDQTQIGSDPFPPVLTQIANAVAERIGSDIRMTESDFSLNCDYLGAGYAIPGDLEFDAIRDLSFHEGILLGPVYTARAMGGFLDLIKKGYFSKNQTVLFWHTGGTPELFAWAEQCREKI